MSERFNEHTLAWQNFSIASFVVAASMMGGGIFFMEAGLAAKGFFAMSAIMLVHTSVTITKTLRDNAETMRLVNKIEDARTEKLLMEVTPSQSD
ncbi:MAG: hypothetical protein GY742_22395 [Hyphomicrobiales bacterium]|nr:hypothetical protein [Hyphomicrobiales bacterium]